MKKDLPIYDIKIKDDDLKQGVGMISLVDEPAIGVNWITLKEQKKCKDCEKTELAEGDACWEGYVQVGTKIVDGREVPNCVPIKDGEPKPQRKLNKILAKRECLGCPPNGDGNRVDGQPDKRCKDGSSGAASGPGGGNKGGSGKGSDTESKGGLTDKIKNNEPKVDFTTDEANKVLERMRELKETKSYSRDGRTITVKRDYQMENWVVEGGVSIGDLVNNWSYTATNGVPNMGGQGGKYFNGTVVATVIKNSDGTRSYNFSDPGEKKKFFDRLGL